MRKHIFTLGLLLSSFCIMPIMADWNGPTKTTNQNMYTDRTRQTPAIEHCSDCCGSTCWLPDGIYYNANGTRIIHKCSAEPSAPTCNSKMTYTLSAGECSGCYGLTSDWCLNPKTNGNASGYVATDGAGGYNVANISFITGGSSNPSDSLLMQWAVQFDNNHIIKGMAACSTQESTDDSVDNDQNGTFCWCQMTSPKKTKWVSIGLASPCQINCPGFCANLIQGTQNAREALLNTIQDDTQQ